MIRLARTRPDPESKIIGENMRISEILRELIYTPIDTSRGLQISIVTACIVIAISRLRHGRN